MLRTIGVLLCALSLGPTLSALTVKPLSFLELVQESAVVVHGRVAEVRGQWTADRRAIDSLVVVDAVDYLKGALGGTVTVRVPGGQAGSFVNIVPGAPTFREGDRVVLFLKVSGPAIPVITGTSQGVYRVTTDPASGVPLVVPPVIDAAGTGRLVRGDPARRPLPLAAFGDAVRQLEGAR